ncbi:MAG: hypothetical protein GX683_00250 [Ruminococcaceae bacterium]|nr:hypothetical protein [Oscillospiraceae bacterium]
MNDAKFRWWHPFYILLQITWGLPQTLLGLVLFLINIKQPHEYFGGSIMTRWKSFSGISLGLFTFTSDPKRSNPGFFGKSFTGSEKENDFTLCDRMAVHEYGHTFQSIMLGPLYLIVIGIPSTVWGTTPYFRNLRERKHLTYGACYTESWADALGTAVTGRNAIG